MSDNQNLQNKVPTWWLLLEIYRFGLLKRHFLSGCNFVVRNHRMLREVHSARSACSERCVDYRRHRVLGYPDVINPC